MPMTIADAADLTDAQIQEIYPDAVREVDRSWSEIYSVETGVTELNLRDSSISGLGYAGRVVENAALPEGTPVQGFDQLYTQAQYGITFTVSKLQWFFGVKKRNLENLTREAVKAVGHLRSRRLYEKLDNAWSTSYTAEDITGNYTITTTGGDGAALISTAHTREDGGTNNNNQITDGTTVNMDMGYDAIKAMHRTMRLIRDYRGLPRPEMRVRTIVVGADTVNEFMAREMLGAIQKNQVPQSADNDASGVTSFKIHATPWLLNNPLYWFGVDTDSKDGSQGSLMYKESQDIELSPVNIVFKTKELQWTAESMFAWGHNGYRNIVGSKNTNS